LKKSNVYGDMPCGKPAENHFIDASPAPTAASRRWARFLCDGELPILPLIAPYLQNNARRRLAASDIQENRAYKHIKNGEIAHTKNGDSEIGGCMFT